MAQIEGGHVDDRVGVVPGPNSVSRHLSGPGLLEVCQRSILDVFRNNQQLNFVSIPEDTVVSKWSKLFCQSSEAAPVGFEPMTSQSSVKI